MRKPRMLVAALVALALVGAACGGSSEARGGAGGDGALTGSIFISGSSTVEPISSLVAELFAEENPDVEITVEGPGTGDGFELFCNGETDISDASRPIEQEEIDACEANGIEYTELEVALDGISVLTSPGNDSAQCLNSGDLYALVGPESEGFDSWADANDLAAEVDASAAPYPDAPLDITAPGEESGTYDAFIELSGIPDIAVERGLSEDESETTRPDYQASANDNVIIDGIAGSDTSFGWVGFSFFEQNQDVVKAFEIDGGEGCVAPSFETIADGSYPLSRSLYIYVNNAKAAENDALASYVDFYLSDTGLRTAVQEVAYVVLPDDRIEATRGTWESASPA
ncbi:MAG TPA: substrate-binding domain-containing protein [Actinomycetota bacterium]|nr:substrate-binding domain-containing protein [Actinomycetota bacterium]